MEVSKGLYIRIKRTDVFSTLMDKPTRTLASARCKSVNERLGPISFKFEPKPANSKKPKSLDTLNWLRSFNRMVQYLL